MTVVAPTAILEALATPAFMLGPTDGLQLLDRLGVDELILTPELEGYQTPGLCRG